MRRAIVLLSGGMDSAVTLAMALSRGYEAYPIIFDYGQKNIKEMTMARKLCEYYSLTPKIIKADLTQIGGSALTDDNIPVPHEKTSDEIPITYVPARNTIFLSYALAYAEVISAESIFIGVNARDYSGYPDCRPEYYEAFRKLAALATKKGVENIKKASEEGITTPLILTPLIYMSKEEIVTVGATLGVPFELTWSCYESGDKACGKCESCLLRKKGFREANIEDPIPYRE